MFYIPYLLFVLLLLVGEAHGIGDSKVFTSMLLLGIGGYL
jgi:hypothetical protein